VLIDTQEVLLKEIEAHLEQIRDVELTAIHFLREELAHLIQVENLGYGG